MPLEPSPGPEAWAACRAVCRRHAKSFYFASHFLPQPKRNYAYAVYSFCRGIDDAVDTGDPETIGPRLAAFAEGLDAIYQGRPLHPHHPTIGNASATVDAMSEEQQLALTAFAHTVRQCQIPQRYFLDLAEGCRADLTIHRYATWAELEHYCYLVAGVVGLIMCHVFGLRDPSALGKAVQMGNAMQLTNILRDVREDAAPPRGRVYLPQDELAAHGLSDQDILAGRFDDRFAGLMKFQIDRARLMYIKAAAGLASLEADGSRQTACTMAVVYAGILRAIERQGYDVFSCRARVSFVGKLRRIPAARRLAKDARTAPQAFDLPA